MIADHLVFNRLVVGTNVPPIPLRTVLVYDPQDPLIVQLVFLPGAGEDVVWLVGRDLLADGLSRRAGLGEVVVQPHPDGVLIELASPEGDASFVVDETKLRRFLDATFDEVPAGAEAERLGIDVALLELLAAGGGR